MKRRGGLLLAIGIVIVVLLIGVVGAGIYFYNFFVFKTVRICVGDATDVLIPCDTTQDCFDMGRIDELNIDLDGAPSFVQDNFQNIFDEVVYCDETCYIRNVRGVNLESLELDMLDSCRDREIEFLIEIRGKEAFEVWRWVESQKG